MARKADKINSSRKLRSSYMTSVVSTALVLFLLGLLGLLIINAKSLGDFVKENLGFSVILEEGTREADIVQIQRSFDATGFVKETNYITPEQAVEDLQEELGENFMEFLGFNPLKPSIDIKLVASYANPDSVAMIERTFLEYPQVKEVFYQESLVHVVNENVRKISLVMFVFSAFLFFISIALFNNTIRLLVYSKRFIIKTMQMVGATRPYILKPFMIKGVTNGLAGAFIASIMFLIVVYIAQRQMPELIVFTTKEVVGGLMLFIFAMGVLMAWFSTLFAVNKYLRSDQDALYY